MAPLDAGDGLADSDDALSFLSGGNAPYLSQLYAKYVVDRTSVEGDWREFFDALGPAEREALTEVVGPSWARKGEQIIDLDHDALRAAVPAPVAATNAQPASSPAALQASRAAGPRPNDDQIRAAARDSIEALRLVRSYRIRGHLYADLDPLGLKENTYHPELDPKTYGFTEADMDRPIFIGGALGIDTASLREILDALTRIYAGKIGSEFQYISDPDQKAWLQERVERADELNRTDFSTRGRRAIYERVVAAEQFEKFLDVKFKGTKRFGVDGGEAMIPALEQILKRGSQMGLKEVVLGMPHRGRLNVLTNFMGKPFRAMFSEFQGTSANPDDFQGSGDVKYHLGTSDDREFDGQNVHLSLTANPSHLEAVNPVVAGKVRAKQQQRGDNDRTEVMALLLHGDAAFAGQGIVPETLDLSGLKGYRTGGTMHFIVNNQIGFTTNPINSRSGPYCTEVAKIVEAPIFHVNGDDPEAVVHVARVAIEFRQTFKKDVVIDMICYRRFGHNEGDEPAFTQPLMYKKIAGQESVQTKYGRQLVELGVLTAEEVKQIADDFKQMLAEEFEASASYKPNNLDWLEGKWQGLSVAEDGPRRGKTALSDDDYDRIAKAMTTIPGSFNANRKVTRLFEQRRKALVAGEGIDWGTAENLAYASLLEEGYPIRFTGQDVERGTFSHRHAVITDQTNEATYTPVNNISDEQALLEIHNSPLSELAVLGYEHGYSLAEPNTLTMWEAQFGDFANGAQIIFDQFISSAESKWARMSGLTMLLPHGYEGQGPEHSSARPERFLQMCAEDNMQIANCTLPANFFHLLRRQMKRDFRKPLIVFTPKSLLRHKRAVSTKLDFTNGSGFHRVIYDNDRPEKKGVKRVVICTGKVYYDLKEQSEELGITDQIYFLRLEQLYPFPKAPLVAELKGLESAEVVFCQEEPKNMGWWAFVEPNIEEALIEAGFKQTRAKYAGRAASASPATGSAKRHAMEQSNLIAAALTGAIETL